MDRAPLVLALGVALAAVTWVNVEWTFPYCNDQSDGPATAVFGMPLPYQRDSSALSHRVELSPLAFTVDVALVFMLIAPVLVAVRKRVEGARASALMQRAMLWGGVLACIAAGGWNVLWWWAVAMPVWSIVPPTETYLDFRPIGISAGTHHHECTPSAYWFREDEWVDRQRTQ